MSRPPTPGPGRAGSDRADGGGASESVWDYPRPPRLEKVERRIRVVFGGVTIADTTGAFRVLETSHPPNYYLPPGDVLAGCLTRTRHRSSCEWKGVAHYFDVRAGGSVARDAAWGYDHPTAAFADITGHVAFYPGPMDACLVDEEVVEPQPGGFYGGWITSDVVGPYKGGPGTQGW
ncbi:MAG TPA: DUF427 domain-containing protein [Acidimicrobiales bacterium]